jgi:uncharacterized protein YebE (UPF0316 family)
MVSKIIITFVAGICFVLMRTLDIRIISSGHKWQAVVSGIVTSSLWLLSSSFGITAMNDFTNEWPIVLAYLVSVGFGVYFGMDLSDYLNKK